MQINIGTGRDRKMITFPCGDAELNSQMRGMGIDDMVPYGKINSVSKPLSGLEPFIGKTVNLDELNYYVKRWESMTEYQKTKLCACISTGEFTTLRDMINLTFHEMNYHLIDDFIDMKTAGLRIYLDKYGGIVEEEKSHWDFEKLANDTMKECAVKVTSYGVLLDEGGEMEQKYCGEGFPEYLYDMDAAVLSLAIQNADGKRDYLYLPTDIVSMDKLKSRLGVESFSECRVTESYNIRLPDDIYQSICKIGSIEDLTAVNELCSRMVRMGDEGMERLSMAARFAKAEHPSQMAELSRHLHEFEIVKGVHDLKEYGDFIINKSNTFEVDELIQPYIDYEQFAKDKIAAMYQHSEFIEDGFVACDRGLEEILSYKGEFADLLEIPEMDYEVLRLYNRLTGDLYEENEFGDTSMDEQPLSAGELVECQEQILDAIKQESCTGEEARGMMHYFDDDRAVAGKVIDARPTVEEYQGELYGVLECRLREPLTPEELNKLECFWNGQESDGWGEGFEQTDINVEGGRLNVHFWNCKEYSIQTEEQLKGSVQNQTEAPQMQM